VTTPVLTFFNNKGGVGKTTLVYHLAWMFADMGIRVLAVDLDPQSSLSAAFLDEERLEALWSDDAGVGTIHHSVRPLLDVGDFAPAELEHVGQNLALLPGHLGLANFEDELSSNWTEVMGGNKARPFRVLTAFWRSAQEAAKRFEADLIVFDVGPNLGAINRAALIGSDHVVVPLGGDLFSLQGLRNLGPTLRNWREGWRTRRASWHQPAFELPAGEMAPIGYVAMRHGVRLTRPVKAYTRWLDQIPGAYRHSVLGEPAVSEHDVPPMIDDPHCLAMLKNYHSLMPLGQEARRPIFALRPADGAIGAHANAVREAHADFAALAANIVTRDDPSAPPAD